MPIEARGKRDPELAARIRSGVLPEDDDDGMEYVVGRRPLKVGAETRMPGEPIPEAAQWPRLESWLRTGAVKQRVRQQPPPASRRTRQAAPVRQRRAGVAQRRDSEEQAPTQSVLRPRRGANA